MKFSVALILISVAGSGCRTATTTARVQPPREFPEATEVSIEARRVAREMRTAELRKKLKAVSTADGISKPEAELIGECYFHRNVGCGGFTGIRDGGSYWIICGAIGVAAKPIQGFHIDKNTGRMSSSTGLIYATPFEIFP